jgi:hypothetical protein
MCALMLFLTYLTLKWRFVPSGEDPQKAQKRPQTEVVNRRTDNTMANKRTNDYLQNIIQKTKLERH